MQNFEVSCKEPAEARHGCRGGKVGHKRHNRDSNQGALEALVHNFKVSCKEPAETSHGCQGGEVGHKRQYRDSNQGALEALVHNFEVSHMDVRWALHQGPR